MIKSKVLIVFLPILILTLAIPASAQDLRWQAQPYNFLDLTEEQMAAIQEQRLAFQKDILSLRTQLMAGYMELDNLYMQNAEQQKIEGKIAELDQMELEFDNQFEAHQQQISALLTDEQKVLFDRFGGLGMGPAFGMGYGAGYGRGMGYGAGYGRGMARGGGYGMGYGAGYGRGMARGGGYGMDYGAGYGRGAAWSGRRGMGMSPAYGMGYGRAPARGINRGVARAGAWNARGFGRGMGYNFPRCWRWR
jgi:hypothetical protein